MSHKLGEEEEREEMLTSSLDQTRRPLKISLRVSTKRGERREREPRVLFLGMKKNRRVFCSVFPREGERKGSMKGSRCPRGG